MKILNLNIWIFCTVLFWVKLNFNTVMYFINFTLASSDSRASVFSETFCSSLHLYQIYPAFKMFVLYKMDTFYWLFLDVTKTLHSENILEFLSSDEGRHLVLGCLNKKVICRPSLVFHSYSTLYWLLFYFYIFPHVFCGL